MQEAMRVARRERTQTRARGVALGRSDDAEWLAAVRMSRKRGLEALLPGRDSPGSDSGKDGHATDSEQEAVPRYLSAGPRARDPLLHAGPAGPTLQAAQASTSSVVDADQPSASAQGPGHPARPLLRRRLFGTRFVAWWRVDVVYTYRNQSVVNRTTRMMMITMRYCSTTPCSAATTRHGRVHGSVSDAQLQARLPTGDLWKARAGPAGTHMDERRTSPIVEISMLLVGACYVPYTYSYYVPYSVPSHHVARAAPLCLIMCCPSSPSTRARFVAAQHTRTSIAGRVRAARLANHRVL